MHKPLLQHNCQQIKKKQDETLIMQCLLEEANQFCFSLKSYQDNKIAKYFVIAKCYYIVKFVYVYQVTPSLT